MKKIHQRFMALLLVCLMVIGMLPTAAFAAGAAPEAVTYYVANSSSGGSNTSGDGTVEKPYMTISHALQAAADAGESDLIISLRSNMEISKTLELNNSDVNLTIQGNDYGIIYKGSEDLGIGTAAVVVDNGMSVAFDGLEITRQDGLTFKGGLVYVSNAEVSFQNVNLTEGYLSVSDVDDGGSAIHVAPGGDVTLLSGVTVNGNTTVGNNTSGAIFVDNGAKLTVNGAIISHNNEKNDVAYGSGIYVKNGGELDIYSNGDGIVVSDEIYVEVGADASVGSASGQSGNVSLTDVYLESEVTDSAGIATLNITGETSQSTINVEMLENYHYNYRLISAEDGYSINTQAGNMDETGWSDACGKWDIRYMDYKGVPGLYLYYFTVNASFEDVDTLTGITGKDVNGDDVYYYNPSVPDGTTEIANSTISDGVLTVPEVISVSGTEDFTFEFTVDEANKEYRIPTPDQVSVNYGSTILHKDVDYTYTPDYENGSAVLTVNKDSLAKLPAGGTLEFHISGEKYAKLTLQMNGPAYTMSSNITGETMEYVLDVAEVVANDGASLTYTITRNMRPVSGVVVTLYQESTETVVSTSTTNADGVVTFDGLNPNYSYYYILSYHDDFHVIERDEITVQLSTYEGQYLSSRCDFDATASNVAYSVADAENYTKATSVISGVTNDTTVTYYVKQAQDRINFVANQQDSTTADTATFTYNEASYRQDEFSKTMETNANTYGNLPGITMEGYTFMGWYPSEDWSDSANKVESKTPYDTLTSPKVLYAHWQRNDVAYAVDHWVEYVEHGVNPGFVLDVTETKTVNGTQYYLWSTDNYNDAQADTVLDSVLPLALTEMVDPAHSWWTLDGFDVTADTGCHVNADGSSVFNCYYDRKEYTITFNPVEGSMMSEQNTLTGRFGAEIGSMLTAYRQNYIFAGWHYNVEPGKEVVVTATSVYTWLHDIEVFARWTTDDTTYIINVMVENKSYDDNGLAYANGTYTQFKTIPGNIGQSDTAMTVPISNVNGLDIEGFTYIGYNSSGDADATGLTLKSDSFDVTPNEHGTTNIYLYYSRNEVDVTFKDDTGADAGVHHEVTIVYGDDFEAALPETNPTKPGYDFVGWADENGNPITAETETDIYTAEGDGAMDVFPVWEARVYYLTYVPGEGATFDTSAMGAGYTVNSNVKGGYTVNQPITYNELIGKMPDSQLTGHRFLGWQLKDGPAAGQMVTEYQYATVDNVIVQNDDNSHEETYVLYAVYDNFDFTLVLDPGDGTIPVGEPSSVPVSYGEPIPALPTPVLDGYTFVGWMLDTGNAGGTLIDGGDIWTYLTTDQATVTAHAMYHPNVYNYKLDLNDVNSGNGSTVATLYDSDNVSVDIVFGSPYAEVLDNLVAIRNGYEFLGWSTSKDLADIITDETVNDLASNSTVYAMWRPLVSELHINLNGGQLPMTNSYSWNRYAEAYYEDYEAKYASFGVASGSMEAYQDSDGIWIVPIIFDTVYGELDQLTKDNYHFEGYLAGAPRWYDTDGNHVVHGQIINDLNMNYDNWGDEYVTLDAVWTPYFDFVLGADDAQFDDGTSVSKHILKAELGEMGALPVAVREGYTFLGWYDAISDKVVTYAEVMALDEYRSFTAVWTPNVTFVGNGGKVIVDGVPHDTYTIGLQILVDRYGNFFTATHDTQTFRGWIADDGSDVTQFENIIHRAQPLTLTASWDIMIHFDVPTGAVWSDGTTGDKYYTAVEVGSWPTLPTMTMSGHSFLYWFNPETGEQVTSAMLGKVTETTRVEPAFRADGGPVTPTGINVTVKDYTKGNATWTEPVDGWFEGDNQFVVNCSDACVVVLVRDGVMTELSGTSVSGNDCTFVVNAQDGDEIQIALRGDANLSGFVDVMDMSAISQYLVGLYQLDGIAAFAADANLSDFVDVMDMSAVSQNLVGLYDFPWNLSAE